MITVSDNLDVIVEPRYDTSTIPTAGSLSLTFFQVPIGQGQTVFGAAGITKSLSDTNMDLAGQLPAGYNFKILGFRCQPSFGLTALDAQQWSFGGVFLFTIGSKPYLRVPLDTIPAGAGPSGYAAIGGAGAPVVQQGAAHGWPALSNAYTIGKKPLTLQQTQNFSVQVTWPVLAPVSTVKPYATSTAGLTIRVLMDGFLYRIVQ